eukprot:SAG22_NODE_294_length_12872_cov_47.391372_5_plen_447_part_00
MISACRAQAGASSRVLPGSWCARIRKAMSADDGPGQLTVGGATLEIPVIEARVEGKGNGIKTAIHNCTEVSKIISRHPAWTTKFLSVETGCISTFDHDSGNAVLTGKHDGAKLQQVFKKFIKNYVLCPKCKGLQTKLDIDKKGKVILKCKGCGHKGEVDQSHKVVKEITKVPPGSGKKEKGDKEKKEPKKGKKDRRKALKEDDSAAGGGGDEEDEVAALAEAAQKAKKAEKREATEEEKAAKAAKKAEKEAKKAAKAAKDAAPASPPAAAANAAGNADDEPEAHAPEPAPELQSDAEYTQELLAKIKADGLAITASWWNGVAAELPVDKAVSIPFGACFDAGINKQVKKFQRIFVKLCGEGKTEAQLAMLKCTAALAEEEATVMAKLGHSIKALYDADLAEEESINEWFAGLADGECKKNSAGFVKWLATVESSSEEDGSDESDDE